MKLPKTLLWNVLFLSISCLKCFSTGLDQLMLITAPSRSLHKFMGNTKSVTQFKVQLDSYLKSVYPSCPRGTTLENLIPIVEKVPALSNIAWADTNDESYDFTIPGNPSQFVLRRVKKTLLSLILFESPEDCSARLCNAKDKVLMGNWAMMGLGSRLFVLESNGEYTGSYLGLIPVKRDNRSFLLAVPHDTTGIFSQNTHGEPFLFSILERLVGGKSYLGDLALLDFNNHKDQNLVFQLTSQGQKDQLIGKIDEFRLRDPIFSSQNHLFASHCSNPSEMGETQSEDTNENLGPVQATPSASQSPKNSKNNNPFKKNAQPPQKSNSISSAIMSDGSPADRFNLLKSQGPVPSEKVQNPTTGPLGNDASQTIGFIDNSSPSKLPNMPETGIASDPTSMASVGSLVNYLFQKPESKTTNQRDSLQEGIATSPGSAPSLNPQGAQLAGLNSNTGNMRPNNSLLNKLDNDANKGSTDSGQEKGNGLNDGTTITPDTLKRNPWDEYLRKEVDKVKAIPLDQSIKGQMAKGWIQRIAEAYERSDDPTLREEARRAMAKIYFKNEDPFQSRIDLGELRTRNKPLSEMLIRELNHGLCNFCIDDCPACKHNRRGNPHDG